MNEIWKKHMAEWQHSAIVAVASLLAVLLIFLPLVILLMLMFFL